MFIITIAITITFIFTFTITITVAITIIVIIIIYIIIVLIFYHFCYYYCYYHYYYDYYRGLRLSDPFTVAERHSRPALNSVPWISTWRHRANAGVEMAYRRTSGVEGAKPSVRLSALASKDSSQTFFGPMYPLPILHPCARWTSSSRAWCQDRSLRVFCHLCCFVDTTADRREGGAPGGSSGRVSSWGAKCWKALGCFSELKEERAEGRSGTLAHSHRACIAYTALQDASKVLKLTGNRDSDALQWHRPSLLAELWSVSLPWVRAADEGLQHKSRSRDREVLQPREASGMEAGCVLWGLGRHAGPQVRTRSMESPNFLLGSSSPVVEHASRLLVRSTLKSI